MAPPLSRGRCNHRKECLAFGKEVHRDWGDDAWISWNEPAAQCRFLGAGWRMAATRRRREQQQECARLSLADYHRAPEGRCDAYKSAGRIGCDGAAASRGRSEGIRRAELSYPPGECVAARGEK